MSLSLLPLLLTGCGIRLGWDVDHDEDNDGYKTNEEPDDCNDRDASINPGATEVAYDSVDQDCDGSDLTDVDGDGHDADSVGGDDCDDDNPDIHPDADEICNGIDDDCDSYIDEGVLIRTYQDYDGDQFGNSSIWLDECDVSDGYVLNDDDCDDSDANVYPGAVEDYTNEIDDDCDGRVDDEDEDGYTITNDGDCDDQNDAINPGAQEVCDGIDNDCDGDIDEDVMTTWYIDNDGDGYGSSDSTLQDCTQPAGYVDNNGDCDDNDPTIYLGAEEDPTNGVDDNCNGYVDELTVDCDSYSYPTIQEAVDVAVSDGVDQVIYVCSGTYNENVVISPLGFDLIMAGESVATLTGGLELASVTGAFTFINMVTDNAPIRFSGSNSSMAVNGCSLTNSNDEPAIYFNTTASSLTVNDSTISGNNSETCCSGGAIQFSGDMLTIESSTISNNTGQYNLGGAISLWDGNTIIEDSTVENNSQTSGFGAAVWLEDSFSYYLWSINTNWNGNSPEDVYADGVYTAGATTDFFCSNGSCF